MKVPSLIFISLFLFGSCRQESESSAVKIFGGQVVDSSTFPAVIELGINTPEGFTTCTGTFISRTKVITAAHCLYDVFSEDDVELVRLQGGKLKTLAIAEDIKLHPRYLAYQSRYSLGENPYDLAIVEFPNGFAQATMSIAQQPPRSESVLELVGFGDPYVRTGANGRGESYGIDDQKRYGLATIESYSKGMILTLAQQGKAQNGSGASAILTGDSGGPALYDGKILGIASSTEYRNKFSGGMLIISRFVDLTTQDARDFLISNI